MRTFPTIRGGEVVDETLSGPLPGAFQLRRQASDEVVDPPVEDAAKRAVAEGGEAPVEESVDTPIMEGARAGAGVEFHGVDAIILTVEERLNPLSVHRSGAVATIIDFFHDKGASRAFCDRFYDTPLKFFKPEARPLIETVREAFSGDRTCLYLRDYREIKGLFIRSFRISGSLHVEDGNMVVPMPELPSSLGKKEARASAAGILGEESRRLREVQGNRILLDSGLHFRGVEIGLMMKAVIDRQYEEISMLSLGSIALQDRLTALGCRPFWG